MPIALLVVYAKRSGRSSVGVCDKFYKDVVVVVLNYEWKGTWLVCWSLRRVLHVKKLKAAMKMQFLN